MIALKQQILRKIKKESLYVLISLIVLFSALKIAFIKEDISVLFQLSLSIFWLFVLPGYSIMFYWEEKLGFMERMILGIFISAAIIGVFGYYLGLIGINLKYLNIVLPILMLLFAGLLNSKKLFS